MKIEAKSQTQASPQKAGGHCVVLVGTYKGDQLEKWRGWYCWPLDKDDVATKDAKGAKGAGAPRRGDSEAISRVEHEEHVDDTTRPTRSSRLMDTLSSITELWLFRSIAEQRNYCAEFVGVKTREELKRDYGYLSWERGDLATKNAKGTKGGRVSSRSGKAHGTHYALFKTEFLYRHKNTPQEEAEAVIVRTKDFAKRSPKIAAQLKAYLESPARHDPDLAKLLPSIITKLPPKRLRVCQGAVQLSLFSWEQLQPIHLPRQGRFTAVELFAGAGGLSIGLERAGIHVVIANEIMPDFAATLAANHPDTNVINDDIHEINAATNPKCTIFDSVSGFKRMLEAA